jgi:uncharacterized protein YjdB
MARTAADTPIVTLPATQISLSGYVWLQDLQAQPFDGSNYNGTRGQSRRMEGFEIAMVNPPGDLGLRYQVWIENMNAWSEWYDGGTYAGTKNEGLRCEAFKIELTGYGLLHHGYSVEYMAHQQNNGDIGPFRDGELCGTLGKELRLEGMAVSIVHP